jgi:hypothetical protein
VDAAIKRGERLREWFVTTSAIQASAFIANNFQKGKTMQPQNDDLGSLVRRVQQADREAKTRLERQLGPGLAYIVRRVLERGTAHSLLEQRILMAARLLTPRAVSGRGDPPAALLARNLCQIAIHRLWPGHTEEAWQTTIPA